MDKESPQRHYPQRMDTWHGGTDGQNDTISEIYKYVRGVKGLYGATDNYSRSGKSSHAYDPNTNHLTEGYMNVSSRRRHTLDVVEKGPLLPRSISEDNDDFTFRIYGDKEQWTEDAPLLADGRKALNK